MGVLGSMCKSCCGFALLPDDRRCFEAKAAPKGSVALQPTELLD